MGDRSPADIRGASRRSSAARVLLTLALGVALVPTTSAQAAPFEETVDGITYLADDEVGSASVIGYDAGGPMGTEPVIPDKVDLKGETYEVLRIGDMAFQSEGLTQVTLPGSLTHIGASAFAFNDLTQVTLPASLTHIGSAAFMYNDLTTLTVPDSVTSIDSNAFYANDLINLDLSESGAVIGLQAFGGNNLTHLILPDAVTTIGTLAFANNALTRVTFGSSVSVMGNGAFSNNALTDVDVPASVSSVGSGAFGGNPGLLSVTFEGDAPVVTAAGSDGSFGEAAGKTVFFSEGASGFTTPTWEGYASEALVTEPPVVVPPVVAPSGPVATRLRLNRRPKRDRVAPYVFRVKAAVRGEFAVSSAVCGGRVRMVVRKGKKRLARARVPVRPNCTTKAARLRITPKKLRQRGIRRDAATRLRVVAVYSGSPALQKSRRQTRVVIG